MPDKVSVQDILDKKHKSKISCLTAYDAPMASVLDSAGLDIILVGDSLGNVVLGQGSTRSVTIEDMLRHTKAVRSAVKRSLLVADMPYDSFIEGDDLVMENAGLLINEAGAEAVKIEGSGNIRVIKEIITSGIPVMGHLGHLPQSDHEPHIHGKDRMEGDSLIVAAKELQASGVFAIVLELVDPYVSRQITEILDIPTIGIGSGPFCDGQILVTHDMAGFYHGKTPRFVKKYADLSGILKSAVEEYISDVKKGTYPSSPA